MYLEKYNLYLEKYNLYLEKYNLYLEKYNLYLEKYNLYLEKYNLYLEKYNLYLEKYSYRVPLLCPQHIVVLLPLRKSKVWITARKNRFKSTVYDYSELQHWGGRWSNTNKRANISLKKALKWLVTQFIFL